MSDSTTSAPGRFAIVVPEPLTRLNMGKPQTGTQAFGYPGISMQAQSHLFADIGKTVHVQAGSNVHLQAGMTWDQFAYKNMTLASKANGTFAVSAKLVLAAGAGNRDFPSFPSGTGEPDWRDYNNLELHHLVDSISNTLKNLFYGEKWKALQKKDKDAQEAWFKSNDASQKLTGADAPDGMLREVDAALAKLGFDRKTPALFSGLLDAMKWTPGYKTTGLAPGPFSSSEFPLISADPYTPSPVRGKGFGKAILLMMATTTQLTNSFRRMSDVVESLIPALSEFDLVTRAKGFILAVQGLEAFWAGVQPSYWEDLFTTKAERAKEYGGEALEEQWGKEATRAELVSAPAPFRLSSCQSFELEIQDKKSGKAKVVNLATMALPAKLDLTIDGRFSAVRLDLAGSGSLVLDGVTASYDATSQQWTGLPDGFSYDASSGLLTKGGGLFLAASPSGGVAFEDRTFSSGKVVLVVDGTTHSVPGSAAFNGLTATARAAQIGAGLGGIGGVTATASGAVVSLTTSTLGAQASLSLVASEASHKELGLEGESVGGGEALTLETAKELLESVGGNYTVEVVGAGPQMLQVTHNLEGDASYLEFSGEPAMAIFGANPASAEGTGERTFNEGMSEVYELLEGTALQQRFLPVFQGFDRLAQVAAKLQLAAASVGMMVTGSSTPPAHLALVAGNGGMSLASRGKVFQAGHSLTLVAAGKMAEPSSSKFIPLLEHGIHLLERANEWMAEKTGPKPPDPAARLDAISAGSVNVLARTDVRVLSVSTLSLLSGGDAKVKATGALTLGTQGVLEVVGKDVKVGGTYADGDTGNSVATATIDLSASQRTKLSSGLLALAVNGKKGKFTMATMTKAGGTTIDRKKIALELDAQSVRLGDDQGRFPLDKTTAQVVGAKKVQLGVGSAMPLEATDAGVSIAGKLAVGTALTVKGDGVAELMTEAKQAVDDVALQKSAIEAKVKVLVTTIETLETTQSAIQKQLRELAEQHAWLPQSVEEPAATAAQKVVDALEKRIRELEQQVEALRSEAIENEVEDQIPEFVGAW